MFKVNDASLPVGSRMPVGGSLSQAQIDTIRNWILQGVWAAYPGVTA